MKNKNYYMNMEYCTFEKIRKTNKSSGQVPQSKKFKGHQASERKAGVR